MNMKSVIVMLSAVLLPMLVASAGVRAEPAYSRGAHHPRVVIGHIALNTHLVTATEKIIEGTVVDIQWLPDHHHYEVLFMLTDAHKIYRSADGGASWVDQSGMMTSQHWESHSSSHKGFLGIYVSEMDPDVILFEGQEGRHAITTDAGRSYRAINHHETLGEFKLHPKERNLILASTLSHRCIHSDAEGTCYKNLYVSHDIGATWHFLTNYVVQFDWVHNLKRGQADHLPSDAIFATVMAAKMGHQNFGEWDSRVDFVMTSDMFATHTLLVPRGNRFLFTDKFLCVAQVSTVGQRVSLELSSDGARSFISAALPYAIQQHSYTILDTSEDSLFLHVNHKGEQSAYGHVYVSNSLGTNYTLSLPHNRRDENGKCDFEKLQSMEGVYIANYIDNVEEMEEHEQRAATTMGQEETENQLEAQEAPSAKIMSVITHDKGSTWTYLTPPTEDAHHRPVHCSPPSCHLHLHGVTDVYGPFYSTPSAVGLIMATGCIGDRLCFVEDEINTYLSRDAGHSWQEVAKGSHIYEFGDHGGLIVMAFDAKAVTEILYSWNEGIDWHQHRISDQPILVDNIMIEPTSRAMKFIIYGTRKTESGVRMGVVFQLDFSQLHTPQCRGRENIGSPDSDYEHWSPSATENHDLCLMGHTIMYVRRKQTSPCFNGMLHEPHHLVKHCQCTEADYECDFGFKREHQSSGTCVRDPTVMIPESLIKPAYCPRGSYFHVSDGHRKIAGDTCVGGVKHEMNPFPCHGDAYYGSRTGWFVLSFALLLVICLGSMTYCQKRSMGVCDSLPVVGRLCSAVALFVSNVFSWLGDIVSSWRSSSPGTGYGSGYRKVPGGNQGLDAFDFDEQPDEDDLGDLALPEDGEPDLFQPGSGSASRALNSSSSLLGGRQRTSNKSKAT